MGVNTARCRSIEPAQDAMQVLGPAFLGAAAQSVAQVFVAQGSGPLRARKKSFEKGAKIESGPAADNGQGPALPAFPQRVFAPTYLAQGYLAQNQPRLARIFSGADVGERVHAIQQVMRNFGALRRTGLGGADFKFPVHCNRVAVDDFTVKAPRNGQRQSGLPACRGTEYDDEQRLAVRHFPKLDTFGTFSAGSKECTASSG